MNNISVKSTSNKEQALPVQWVLSRQEMKSIRSSWSLNREARNKLQGFFILHCNKEELITHIRTSENTNRLYKDTPVIDYAGVTYELLLLGAREKEFFDVDEELGKDEIILLSFRRINNRLSVCLLHIINYREKGTTLAGIADIHRNLLETRGKD